VLLPDFLEMSRVEDESVDDWVLLFVLLLPQLAIETANKKIIGKYFIKYFYLLNHTIILPSTLFFFKNMVFISIVTSKRGED